MSLPVGPPWRRFSHTGGNEKIAIKKKKKTERLEWESDRDKKSPGEFSCAVKRFTLCLNFGRNVAEVSSPALREARRETTAGRRQFGIEVTGWRGKLVRPLGLARETGTARVIYQFSVSDR